MPFLIRHADGRTYELADASVFVREYEPAGFVVLANQPDGYAAPEMPKPAGKGKRGGQPDGSQESDS